MPSRPTLWANELSLWITGFVIFLSGIAAQQQRIHIRIDIVHAGLPRRWQGSATLSPRWRRRPSLPWASCGQLQRSLKSSSPGKPMAPPSTRRFRRR